MRQTAKRRVEQHNSTVMCEFDIHLNCYCGFERTITVVSKGYGSKLDAIELCRGYNCPKCGREHKAPIVKDRRNCNFQQSELLRYTKPYIKKDSYADNAE